MSEADSKKQLMSKKFSFGTFQVSEGGRVAVAFDFSRAPIPKDTYSASFVKVKAGPSHDCFISFYQVDSDLDMIRHKIEIKFDDIALLNAFGNSKDFFGRLKSWYSETYGMPPQSQPPSIREAIPSYQLTANVMFLGHSENSGVAAFYYFDPRAAREIALGRDPNQELLASPVVQVKLSSLILWDLLSQIETYVQDALRKFPKLADKIEEQRVKP